VTVILWIIAAWTAFYLFTPIVIDKVDAWMKKR